METYKIKVILRAIELGSLTKAAAEYEYSASALSQMLTSLEDEIGIKLITRTHTGIEPAVGTEEIIKLLYDMTELEDRIVSIAKEKKNGQKTVTIATYSSISKYILPTAVKRYNALFPNVDINITVCDNFDDYYRKGQADFYLGERIKSEDAIWEKLMTDPFVAVLPNSYDFEDDSISCEELFKNKFIMPKDRNISSYVHRCAGENKLSINSTDDSSVIALVRADMGVSVLSRLAVIGSEGIKTKNLDPPLCRSLGFSYKSLHRLSGSALDFKDFLAEYIRSIEL